MLLELLQKGYGKAMNLNCAEKILYGANWAYNMQLPPQALKIAAGFGGGMGAGAACGVVTGACMVLTPSDRMKNLGVAAASVFLRIA